jgi:hypothetical protein
LEPAFCYLRIVVDQFIHEESAMNRYARDLTLLAGRADQRHVRVALLVLTLILFILGAGAPEGDGGASN